MTRVEGRVKKQTEVLLLPVASLLPATSASPTPLHTRVWGGGGVVRWVPFGDARTAAFVVPTVAAGSVAGRHALMA